MPEPDSGVALAEVVARLRRAMRRAARNADPATTLSVAQLELLSCLAENPGARPSRLAQLLKLAPNTVTTMANGLQAKDLLTRTSGNDDRRTVALELTGAGRDAVRRWQATNTAIVETAVANLHPAWQHLLTAALPALRELVGSIDDLAEAPRAGR
ncbi:MarR family winged helix-turn-helix transcriptional regulator [Amycolatopsis nalaikhensis]|uniref:MarR family transcriptional regulator n=1 Tax=Amycolatopsis nalaikhensis TaxID=715472 RepID=A0ABY8XU20_9PSEU|nr:MarR family transcriptional regulator [Amycolatopsis sp. 2-2]WIV59151.1 MarR family transcriptional regulator [Amycolatopsis sp. 2-2]